MSLLAPNIHDLAEACSDDALHLKPAEMFGVFQEGMAHAARAVMSTFESGHALFINFILEGEKPNPLKKDFFLSFLTSFPQEVIRTPDQTDAEAVMAETTAFFRATL